MNNTRESSARPVQIASKRRFGFSTHFIVLAGLILSLLVPLANSNASTRNFEVALAASDPVIAREGTAGFAPQLIDITNSGTSTPVP